MLKFQDYQKRLRLFLQQASKGAGRQLYIRFPSKDFTRSRKITFTTLATYILQLPKKSSSVAITAFCHVAKIKSFSKTALYLARWKIKILFFQHLFHLIVRWHYQSFGKQRWKGLQLLAVDGTAFRVPHSQENQNAFGKHTNQHDAIASCRLIAWFDVLNDIVIGLSFHKRSKAEIVVAYEHVQNLPEKTLSIYDRGYASTGLLLLHQLHKRHCLIRLKPDMSNITKAFMESNKNDTIVSLRLGERTFYTLRKHLKIGNHIKKHQELHVRLIKIELPTQQTELLATTLLDTHEFKTQHFNWLYQKRWTVETCFDRIKNQLMLGTFSAYRTHFIWQDIWSTFIYHNLTTAYIRVAQKVRDLKTRSGNKYDYLINRNVAAGILNIFFPLLLLPISKARGDPLVLTIKQMAKHVEALRPGRKCPRNRKMMRINDRHQTEKNYKRAF